MSDRHPNIVNAQDVPWIELADPSAPKFAARARRLGLPAGCQRLGCTMYEVPPGKRSCPFHYHLANEEAIYILDGEATLRLGDREVAVRAGDYIALPVGPAHPHQLINASAAPVRYLCMSTLQTPEVAIYPDSGKIGFSTAVGGPGGGPFELGRLGASLAYYDGEDG